MQVLYVASRHTGGYGCKATGEDKLREMYNKFKKNLEYDGLQVQSPLPGIHWQTMYAYTFCALQ